MAWEVKKEGFKKISYNQIYVLTSISIIILLSLAYLLIFKNQFLLFGIIMFSLITIINIFTKEGNKKSYIQRKLNKGEKVLFEVRGINCRAISPASIDFQFGRNILVTNKRILLSFSSFGYMTYRSGLSFYYNKKEYIKNKAYGNYLIKQYKLDQESIIITTDAYNIANFDFKFYTKENKRIAEIIKKSQ